MLCSVQGGPYHILVLFVLVYKCKRTGSIVLFWSINTKERGLSKILYIIH